METCVIQPKYLICSRSFRISINSTKITLTLPLTDTNPSTVFVVINKTNCNIHHHKSIEHTFYQFPLIIFLNMKFLFLHSTGS